MNSKIEEISESCHPNLLKMPDVVMEEVFKNLDFRSIFRLRKVCRGLRFSIDKIKPHLHLHSVSFKVPFPKNSLDTYYKRRGVNVLHGKPKTGCSIEWHPGKFAEISMEEVGTLLKNTNLILNQLNINLSFSIVWATDNIFEKMKDVNKFQESLKSILKNGEHLLRTSKISLQVNRLSQGAAPLLKCIDPKEIKSISICTTSCGLNNPGAIGIDFPELKALEQWKNAEELEIQGNYILTPNQSFASFKTITLCIDVIPIEKLIEVKELFVRSPKMKTFVIKSDEICKMKNQLLSNFGQFDSYNEELYSIGGGQVGKQSAWIWLNDVSGSTEKLRIILNTGRKTGSLSLQKLPFGNCENPELTSISNFRHFAT